MAGASPRRRHGRGSAPVEDPVIPPARSPIDLHSHTTRSDGVLAPLTLVRAAAAAGVRLLAITDHDTLEGVRDLRGAELPRGIEVVPGIELNADTEGRLADWGVELHVIGIGLDPDDDELEGTLERQRQHRRERFGRMVARLRAAGIDVRGEVAALPPAAPGSSLGRPHLARALVEAGHAADVGEAFKRYLDPGKVGYEPRVGLDPVGCVRAIRAAGGVASLAHRPGVLGEAALLRELVDAGLGGLEVHYRTFDRPTTEAMAACARSAGLVATGGTDYHGDDGTYAEAHAETWVPPSVEGPLRMAMTASRAEADR